MARSHYARVRTPMPGPRAFLALPFVWVLVALEGVALLIGGTR